MLMNPRQKYGWDSSSQNLFLLNEIEWSMIIINDHDWIKEWLWMPLRVLYKEHKGPLTLNRTRFLFIHWFFFSSGRWSERVRKLDWFLCGLIAVSKVRWWIELWRLCGALIKTLTFSNPPMTTVSGFYKFRTFRSFISRLCGFIFLSQRVTEWVLSRPCCLCQN